jgi:biotin carboxylase
MEPKNAAIHRVTKTLLIVSGGAQAASAASRARALGHTVVVSDSDPQAPAFAFADSCLIADANGAVETAAAAERYNRKIRKIDGVLCLADYALAAAAVTDRLRLPGIPMHVAELASDRLAIKRSFQSAGIPTPWHAEISTPQELQRVVIARGRAVAIMPVENLGAHGRQLMSDVEDPAAAFQQTREASPSQRMLVELAPEGARLTLDCWMENGACQVAGTNDNSAKEIAGRAVSALGISNGPAVCEIVMHQGAPQVMAIAARAGGEAFLDRAIAAALG